MPSETHDTADIALHDKLRRDPHRPVYHFVPQSNWMNDPNGLIQWNGVYHMFYQYNPHGAFHGTIHWGHATSRDLVHWEHQPVALAPTPGGPDADGCWSGCAVDDNGTPTLIYTGVHGKAQRPCLATSTDDLLTWQKYAGNPIIAAPPDPAMTDFRDHWVWREDGMWHMIIGSSINGVGTVLLYRSHNLRVWECLGPLHTATAEQEPLYTGQIWECPQLLFFDQQAALVISVWDRHRLLYTAAMVGTYQNHRFTPESIERLDYGDKHFYAPQTLIEPGGRKLMWGWIQEGRPEQAQRDAGWSGVMSLPRVVSMHPDGVLSLTPAPELQALRQSRTHLDNIDLARGSMHSLEVHGDALEIIVEAELEATATFGLVVRRSPGGEEQTVIGYDAAAKRLFLDRHQASCDDDTALDVQGGELVLHVGEPLRLHVFLDRSVIEVFANERACLTSRVYPTRADSNGLALVAEGGAARVTTMDVWWMAAIA
ncbi:MAG TPA: glycoside hydrolase family 32 protein [Roseiflexaceae bacterium]|nr:glycoside hydrolase family 32 protein [Roseiflexaceae bacterium]